MSRISRRGFLEGSGAGLVGAAALAPAKAATRPQPPPASAVAVPRTRITITLNGAKRTTEVEDRWTLAELLRDQLGLTGTKVGCDRGECGACTVLLDGRAVYACSMLACWADGREVRTVEGLASGGRLDALQQSFIEGDAPQCGFCTSGQLMSARALLDQNPRPSRDDVREALCGNLCRCSNYERYVDSVLAAGRGRTAAEPRPTRALKSVGRPTPRIDAKERVTGTAAYTGDVRLPGMLYARVLRSPHPHARIVKVDAREALALRGVKAIITQENCSVVWSSGDSRNQRRLFNNPVRFFGDAVAAVAAVDRHVAEEALGRIKIDYEPLAFVLDPEEALEPGAVEIHPGGNLSPDAQGRRLPEVDRRGDVDAALRGSEHVFEGRFTSCHINNAQLEPRVSVALWEGDKLTVYASTQGISNCRTDIAKDLGLAPEKVRVVCRFMGGGFGNKNQCHDFDLMAALLAQQAKAPVKLELTRKEDYIAVHGRWPTRQRYRIGAGADGTLRAIELRAVSGMGPYRKGSGSIAGVELYQCPNVLAEISPAYTNMAVSANFRAPAYPQGVFGIESMMDEVCHALRIDPVEFRLKNLTRRYHDELPYTSNGLEECLRKGAQAFDWQRRRPPASDRGRASAALAWRWGPSAHASAAAAP